MEEGSAGAAWKIDAGGSCGSGAGGAEKAEAGSSSGQGGAAEKMETGSSFFPGGAAKNAVWAASPGAWKADSGTSGEGHDGGVDRSSATGRDSSFSGAAPWLNMDGADSQAGTAAKAAMAASAEKLLFTGIST